MLTKDCDMYLIQLFFSIAFSSRQMNAFVLYILKSLMSDTAAYGATQYNTSSQWQCHHKAVKERASLILQTSVPLSLLPLNSQAFFLKNCHNTSINTLISSSIPPQ